MESCWRKLITGWTWTSITVLCLLPDYWLNIANNLPLWLPCLTYHGRFYPLELSLTGWLQQCGFLTSPRWRWWRIWCLVRTVLGPQRTSFHCTCTFHFLSGHSPSCDSLTTFIWAPSLCLHYAPSTSSSITFPSGDFGLAIWIWTDRPITSSTFISDVPCGVEGRDWDC